MSSPLSFYFNESSMMCNVGLVWHSGSVMDCHASDRGSIPTGNGIYTELPSLSMGRITQPTNQLMCNKLAKPVHCNGRHRRLVLDITIIAHRHASPVQHRRINRDIYITYIKAYR